MTRLDIIERVNAMYPMESIDFKAGLVEAAMSEGKVNRLIEIAYAAMIAGIVIGFVLAMVCK